MYHSFSYKLALFFLTLFTQILNSQAANHTDSPVTANIYVNYGHYDNSGQFENAHLIEHLVAYEYDRQTQSNAALLTAVTSGEHTVYTISTSKKNLAHELQKLYRIFSNPSHSEEEILYAYEYMIAEHQLGTEGNFLLEHYSFKNTRHPIQSTKIYAKIRPKKQELQRLKELTKELKNRYYCRENIILEITSEHKTTIKLPSELKTTNLNNCNREANGNIKEKIVVPQSENISQHKHTNEILLTITVPLPEDLDYFDALINLEYDFKSLGRDHLSLSRLLRNNGYIKGLQTPLERCSSTTHQQCFSINFILTQKGKKHIDELISITHNRINSIRKRRSSSGDIKSGYENYYKARKFDLLFSKTEKPTATIDLLIDRINNAPAFITTNNPKLKTVIAPLSSYSHSHSYDLITRKIYPEHDSIFLIKKIFNEGVLEIKLSASLSDLSKDSMEVARLFLEEKVGRSLKSSNVNLYQLEIGKNGISMIIDNIKNIRLISPTLASLKKLKIDTASFNTFKSIHSAKSEPLPSFLYQSEAADKTKAGLDRLFNGSTELPGHEKRQGSIRKVKQSDINKMIEQLAKIQSIKIEMISGFSHRTPQPEMEDLLEGKIPLYPKVNKKRASIHRSGETSIQVSNFHLQHPLTKIHSGVPGLGITTYLFIHIHDSEKLYKLNKFLLDGLMEYIANPGSKLRIAYYGETRVTSYGETVGLLIGTHTLLSSHEEQVKHLEKYVQKGLNEFSMGELEDYKRVWVTNNPIPGSITPEQARQIQISIKVDQATDDKLDD